LGGPIPERDREHPLEPLREPEAPLLVGMWQQRRVATATDLVAGRLELAPQLAEVVDLAVEDGDDVPALVRDGLVAGLQVDDRKAAVAEDAAPVGGDGAMVRAAMYDRVVHALDQSRVGSVPAEESANPAHARYARLRGRVVSRRTAPRRRGVATVLGAPAAAARRVRDH